MGDDVCYHSSLGFLTFTEQLDWRNLTFININPASQILPVTYSIIACSMYLRFDSNDVSIMSGPVDDNCNLTVRLWHRRIRAAQNWFCCWARIEKGQLTDTEMANVFFFRKIRTAFDRVQTASPSDERGDEGLWCRPCSGPAAGAVLDWLSHI